MKILRITRHEAEESQVSELRRIFGEDVEIAWIADKSFSANPKEMVAEFDDLAQGYDVVEVVLPISLMEAVMKFSAFVKHGGQVIRAITIRFQMGDQVSFNFSHYEKIVKVEVVTEQL